MSSIKNFITTNWFKLFFVALSILAIGIYFQRENALDKCLDEVNSNFDKEWEFHCAEGKRPPACALPRLLADTVENNKAKRSELCFKRYRFLN